MKKYLIVLFLIYFSFITGVKAWNLDTKSENILLYNLTDKNIIYEQNIDKNTKIASLTKIVTVLVALENIYDLNDSITMTEEVFVGLEEADASVAGFKVDEKLTYNDLVYGAMLPSGADATKALALNLFGSERKFVDKMNELMVKLEITNTRFTNTSGLDEEGQKSNLKDLLKIILYALDNPEFVKLFNAKSYITSNGRLTLNSTINTISSKYNLNANFIIGSKTGYTDDAGLCLISYANKNDSKLLLITTNAPVPKPYYPDNVLDAVKIYNYYFDNYGYQNILEKGEVVTRIPTKYSKIKEANLIYNKEDIKYYLPNDYDKSRVKIDFKTPDYITYKDAINSKIGAFDLYLDNSKVYNGELILSQKIDFSIIEFLKEYMIFAGLGVILIIFIIIKITNRKARKHGA